LRRFLGLPHFHIPYHTTTLKKVKPKTPRCRVFCAFCRFFSAKSSSPFLIQQKNAAASFATAKDARRHCRNFYVPILAPSAAVEKRFFEKKSPAKKSCNVIGCIKNRMP
jgi:hypothetical protein